jgi:hypothetical protein
MFRASFGVKAVIATIFIADPIGSGAGRGGISNDRGRTNRAADPRAPSACLTKEVPASILPN